jgi:hypothetical protein
MGEDQFMLSVAVSLLLGASSFPASPASVSPDVKASFSNWAPSAESANYPIAVLELTNTSKKTCRVKRYQIHWSDGTFEGKPTDLKIEPGKTVEHRVKVNQSVPADKAPVVVQVWDADCT